MALKIGANFPGTGEKTEGPVNQQSLYEAGDQDTSDTPQGPQLEPECHFYHLTEILRYALVYRKHFHSLQRWVQGHQL